LWRHGYGVWGGITINKTLDIGLRQSVNRLKKIKSNLNRQEIMAKQGKDAVVLGLTVLITGSLAAAGLWYFSKQSASLPGVIGNISNIGSSIETRLSGGQQVLITQELGVEKAQKQAGAIALGKGDFNEAIAQYTATLKINRNDPETRIYLTNAQIRARGKQSLTVGVSVPIGSNLNVSKEILRGIAQAQLEIFERAKGAPIEILLANDDNQAETAKQVAAEFVKNPQVLAVVGHNTSDVTLAAAPIYQQGGLVMITPTATAKALSGFGSYIFRTAPSVRIQADRLAKYAIKQGKKNFGICISSQSASTRSLQDEFKAAVFAEGGKISQVECDFAATNFDPAVIVNNLTADGVTGLLLAPGIETIGRSLDLARQAGGKFLLLSDATLYTFRTLESGQASMVGTILSVPWHPGNMTAGSFASRAVQLWGGNVNWRSATAFDALSAIATGLNQKSNRLGLQQAISDPKFTTEAATGQLSFQPSGDRQASVVLIQVQPGKQSGTGYDFVKLNF
jgi:branched-chain amino acid transport system substrate-binding protein